MAFIRMGELFSYLIEMVIYTAYESLHGGFEVTKPIDFIFDEEVGRDLFYL